MDIDFEAAKPDTLLQALVELRQAVCTEGQQTFDRWRPLVERRSFLISGLNLAYYLALRRRDLRDLQAALPPWGLSSLGRSEAHVLQNLDAVITALADIVHADVPPEIKRPRPSQYDRGHRLLSRNAEQIFGPEMPHRRGRIMVTMPPEAADEPAFALKLMQAGMNCARINCAHDDAQAWGAMIGHIKAAAERVRRPCKILMDLGGPKVRTGKVRTSNGKEVRVDDRILLTRKDIDLVNGCSFQTTCSMPEVLDQVGVGQAVWIDDGHIGAVVEEIVPEGLWLRVTQARSEGEKLKREKGLNFPDTPLTVDPLTAQDLKDLDFVAFNADMIGYSFVQSAANIDQLRRELMARLGEEKLVNRLAIIAKIETAQAVRSLPEITTAAASKQPFGIMIARGDLAVEIGFQRLAEIQEELLWLAEAAHVPVIWATQVLEGLVKTGLITRAEVTDAAMAERAECVMLNKGEFIEQGVQVLDDTLTRMKDHQLKKSPQLRALRSWEHFG